MNNQITEPNVVVVMPAYNASKTLKWTYADLPHQDIHGIILVDDGSTDETVVIAKELGLTIFMHTGNYGYGANQKTCYIEALKTNANIIVMVHPDYQYDPSILPDLIAPIISGEYDIIFGSRMMGESAHKQGMPWWKYLANKSLTWIENKTFKLNLAEYHTGYRAYRREVLEQVNFVVNSDGFIFDQDIVAQFVACEHHIGQTPVPVRYFSEASSASLVQSTIYGMGILWLCLRYLLHRAGIKNDMRFVCHSKRYTRA